MSSQKRLVSSLLLLLLSAATCSSPGTLTAREERGKPTGLSPAEAGVYGLFIAGDSDPLIRVKLDDKDKIGFEHGQAGVVGEMKIDMVYAVAGQNRMPLDITKTYEWRKL
jgi:hypothetical protein